MNTKTKRLLGASELARELKCTTGAVLRMTRDGCPFVTAGRAFRYRLVAVRAWIARAPARLDAARCDLSSPRAPVQRCALRWRWCGHVDARVGMNKPAWDVEVPNPGDAQWPTLSGGVEFDAHLGVWLAGVSRTRPNIIGDEIDVTLDAPSMRSHDVAECFAWVESELRARAEGGEP